CPIVSYKRVYIGEVVWTSELSNMRSKLALVFLALAICRFVLAADEAPANAAPPDPHMKTLADVHTRFVTAFTQAFGFGPARMDERHSPTPFKRDLFAFVLDGERWKVEKVNLIGLLFHDGKSVVFETPYMGVTDEEYIKHRYPFNPSAFRPLS